MTALPNRGPGFEPMPLEELCSFRGQSRPFPSVVPSGIIIVSFNDFQTSSSVAFFDENDERIDADKDSDECDGMGIVVVQLPTHTREAHGILGKRKKKNKALKSALNGSGAKRPWWEVWEDHESVRRKLYDTRLPSHERLLLAAHDFKEGRLGVWPQPGSGVQNLWDQLKIYLGLPLIRDEVHRKSRTYTADDDEDEISDGEDEPNATSVVVSPPSYLMELDLGDPKTELFLDDPEKSMKIFFSSHFREQGNFSNVQHCLVFPKLTHFFLSYLIRSKVFPEKGLSNALRSAVTVAEHAGRELPLTFDISNTFPDDVNKAFHTLWGPRRTSPMESDEQDRDIAQDVAKQEELHEKIRSDIEEEEKSRAKRVELERERQAKIDRERADALAKRDAEAKTAEAEDATDAQPADGGVPAAEIEVSSGWGSDGTVATGVWGSQTSSGWGSSEGTWGGLSGGWGATQDGDAWESSGWGAADATEQIIDTMTVSTWAPPTLLPFLAVTALPLTHRPGVVERSTRRIKGVLWPTERKACKSSNGPSAENVEEELITKFARVVLEPWSDTSSFGPPSILPSSHGKVDLDATPTPGVTGHSPLRDNITVIVHPDSVTLLQDAVGMGLGATWTQIKRIEVVDGKRVKTKSAKDLWYMEELFQQVPSFWAS